MKTRQEMKQEMIEEITNMTDDYRLVDEYNSFFGVEEGLGENDN